MQTTASPARRHNGTMLPGYSANPNGRPRIVGEIQKIAREAAPAAFARVVALVENTDPRVALAASQEVLNRAWGKPVQAVQSEVKKYDMSALYLAALQAANGLDPTDRAKLVEGYAQETTEDDGAAQCPDDTELE